MAPFNVPLVKLLALCIVSALMCTTLSDCFSTPAARGPARSSMRSINNVGADSKWAIENKENVYLENYITAIESESADNGERGFMVATTDHNYAIYSPALKSRRWLALSVNGEEVFIVTTENRTLSSTLFGLDEQERDFIAELRSNFTQNLAGLKFAHYTSGSSTHLSRPSGPSIASMAISQMKYNKAAYQPEATLSPIPQGASTSDYLHIEWPKPNQSSEAGPPKSERLPASAEVLFKRTLSKRKRSFDRSRPASRLVWRARNGFNEVQHPNIAPQTFGVEKSVEASKSLCSPDRPNDNFNYYNLLQAPLNVTLTGDVYYFDLHCNILDVYSASVSVRQALGLSALYRDANFFSYTRSGMPLAINRFFLVDEQVFFVYNDGSLVVKMDWMLDKPELDVLIEARQQLKLVGHWQGLAADLLAKSVIKRKSSRT